MCGRAGQQRERCRWQWNQGFESRETERDTTNGCHSPGLYLCVPWQEQSSTHHCTFFFLFFGHSCDGKSGGANDMKGLFFFFLGGGGRGGEKETGLNPCAQITKGKKNLIYFFLNLLFPNVLLKFLTIRKISITKNLKKEIKESTRIFFKYCFFEQNYFLILQHVWKPPS